MGACLALGPADVITSTHRGHGHLIGKGGDPRYMMAELAGRSAGYCLGRGGSLHIADFDLGILGANGIVAGGIPISVGVGLSVDGNDVLAVYEAVRMAAERARAGLGPTFIEGKTYRQRGHYEGDPMVYRTQEEMEYWKARDPVVLFRRRLLEAGIFDERTLENIRQEVLHQLDEAVAFAKSAPIPQPDEALLGVYGDTHDGLVF